MLLYLLYKPTKGIKMKSFEIKKEIQEIEKLLRKKYVELKECQHNEGFTIQGVHFKERKNSYKLTREDGLNFVIDIEKSYYGERTLRLNNTNGKVLKANTRANNKSIATWVNTFTL